jgi:curved DNA-binding protein CbpA
MTEHNGDAQLLGLPPNPSNADVKKAWRAFALQWHPDVHPAGPERALAEERFKKAQSAHERLLRASTAPQTGEFHAATENTNASYVRRRRPAPAATPIYGYGSLGYDQNAGAKIAIGLAVFGLFCFWASNAWSRQSTDSRRKQQALSTVSYGAHRARLSRSPAPASDAWLSAVDVWWSPRVSARAARACRVRRGTTRFLAHAKPAPMIHRLVSSHPAPAHESHIVESSYSPFLARDTSTH